MCVCVCVCGFRDRCLFVGDWNCYKLETRALRRMQPRFGPALGASGIVGRVHFPLSLEDIP